MSDLAKPLTRTVLHVGCGTYAPEKLHSAFHSPGWTELRLDIDEGVQPDIVASMTDMSPVADHRRGGSILFP